MVRLVVPLSLLLSCLACRAGGIEAATLVDASSAPGTLAPPGTVLPASDAGSTAAAGSSGNADGNAGTPSAADAGTNDIALSSHAARVLTTVQAAPMATLAEKVPPPLQAQMANIEAAAKEYNLQPQLLVAVAMQESTGGADPKAYENGGGMFQFTSVNTWLAFGTKDPNDRQNDALSVRAAAYYLAQELNDKDGSLEQALRAYNGPISAGGLPAYPSEIEAKMAGKF